MNSVDRQVDLSRRQMLARGTTAATALAISAAAIPWAGAQAVPQPSGGAAVLKAARDKLAGYMGELAAKAKVQLVKGATLLMPQAGGGYNGIWPDDSVYPLMAMPSLADKDELAGVMTFLTDSLVDLSYVPDRVEPDGLPILSPGGSGSAPMTDRMPLHLPAAWVRLLAYYQGFGVVIPRKKDWAGLIARSFDRVPFANGLVYADPQRPPIGFGFHDSIRISGLELMSSLMLYRGLQRATQLFEGDVDRATIDRWSRLAEGIKSNLYRLYDPKIGGYVGGSRQGHQFSVWANGLIYPLAAAPVRAQIVEFYRAHRADIFKLGCTRQIAEPSWQGSSGAGSYQNGGFWATGTGYVLPAIADQDPAWAAELAGELVDNLPKINFAEWIGADAKPAGAMKFLASVSIPLLGLNSILEKRPLIEYF